MSIERIKIANFQSIKSLDLELGQLTIITGHNGSGKSAIRRALELLAFNQWDKTWLAEGEKTASVTAVADWGSVTIERGVKPCEYHLAKNGEDERTFSETYGKVPPQVSEALHISRLNIVDQEDPLYLVNKSGSEVARVLGEITNVNTILEAATTANKRRKSDSTKLKGKEADLERVKQEYSQFKNLNKHSDLCTEAENALEEAESTESQVTRLRDLLADLTVAESALVSASAAPKAPQTDELDGIYEQYNGLVTILTQIRNHTKEMASIDLDEFAITQEQLHKQMHEVLLEVGRCPTCQQEILS